MASEYSATVRSPGEGRAARVAVVSFDPASLEIVDSTGGADRLFGVDADSLTGESFACLHPSDQRRKYEALYRELLDSAPGVVSRFDDGSPIVIATADGDRVPVEIHAVSGSTGEPELLKAVFRTVPDENAGDEYVQQYRTAAESAANPIAAIDDDFDYLFANAAYCEPLEVCPLEIRGQSIEDVLGESVVAKIRPSVETALDGETVEFETTREFPTGEVREYEVTFSPVPGESHRANGVVATFNDVTQRKRRERELERVFDGMNDAVFVHPPDGPFELVNETAVDRYGYSADELCAMSPMELDSQEEVDKVPDRRETVTEKGSVVFETVHETKSGEEIPVEINSAKIQYKGRPAILSIARDVSRRKASERKFEVLFNNASDPIAHASFEDGEPVVEAVNPAFETTFGFDGEDLSRRSIRELFESPSSSFELADLDRRVRKGDRFRREIQRRTPDGLRDYLFRSVPIDASEDEYYRIYTDITERKERERTLVRQRNELQTLNRLNELILDVIQELVALESREGVEETVCRELASSTLYEFAWIGEDFPDSTELRYRSCSPQVQDGVSGDGIPHLDGAGPATEALRTGDVQVVQNVDTKPHLWVTDGPLEGEPIRSIAALPIADRGSVSTVLVVYSPREYAFGGREIAGLETLQKIVEFAIAAIRNRKVLATDTMTELEFDVTGSSLPLVQIAADLDCSIGLEGSVVALSEERLTLYLLVGGTAAEAFVQRANDYPGVDRASLIAETDDGEYKMKVTLNQQTCLDLLFEHKASIDGLDLDRGTGTMTWTVPLGEDTRPIVQSLQSDFPDVSLKSKREMEVDLHPQTAIENAIVRELTDRQYEILKNALLAGYFEWPRECTTEDLGDMLDITSSTVQYHLRTGLQQLVEDVFGHQYRRAIDRS